MKALKVILGILGVIIAAYLVLCLVGPKQMDVSSSMEMEAPASVVYEQIGELTNWAAWGPWQNADETMDITYGEQTSGVGASYSWTSENSGDGTLKVLEASPPNSMKTQLNFGNYDGNNYGTWDLEENEGTTKVTWGMTSDPTPFLMRGMMAVMGMNKKVAEDFNKGLTSMKAIAEENAQNMPTSFGGYDVETKDYPGGAYAGIKETVSFADMQEFMGTAYGKVMAAMAEKEVAMAGAPSSFYYTWDVENGQSEMAAVIPMGEAVDLGSDEVTTIEMPSSKAAVINYYGNYDGLGSAHEAMEAYFKATGKEATFPCLETYITDPTSEPDTSKWLTVVTYFYN